MIKQGIFWCLNLETFKLSKLDSSQKVMSFTKLTFTKIGSSFAVQLRALPPRSIRCFGSFATSSQADRKPRAVPGGEQTLSAFHDVQLRHPAVQSIGCTLASPSVDASSQVYASRLERLYRVASLFALSSFGPQSLVPLTLPCLRPTRCGSVRRCHRTWRS